MAQLTHEHAPSILLYDVEQEDGLYDSGLDWDYIDAVGQDVAETLARESVAEALYQPGDGTRYALVFVPLVLLAAARPRFKDGQSWGTRAVDGMGNPYKQNGYLMARVEGPCYPITLGDRGTLAASYIAEHWDMHGPSSGTVAILLRSISWHLDNPRPL